ncbi:MAG TPA: single-stranded-DNA-specific exonuclease RecJ [Dehalococcoidia bacterium]|nr:single-stranded-DNA-specific exonuclease RecJ [Dehalococcoidia bacterium]
MVVTTTEAAAVLDGSGGRRWRVRQPGDLTAFDGANWPTLISLLLSQRGVRSLDEAQAHFADPLELTDPALMPNLDVAVERLGRACRAGETVAVLGDFDVDGITSTTILVEGLLTLGARPLPYIPHRFTEGYGPNVDAVRQLHRGGATLLVTADCGTSSVLEVSVANELGMEVIVIDHHTVPERLPDALALVNPKISGSAYGSEPAAVGVAYKVIHDLHDQLGASYDPEPHRALVALGTVCDLAPMQAENRDLVRLGMRSLAASERPGLQALAAVAGVELREVDPDMCGWVLGPRLNAAGRMDHGRISLDLLLAETEAEAKPLAAQLEQLNRDRREQTAAAVELSDELLSEADREAPLIFVASPEISAGIVGLVASRLVDRYNCPAIAMQILGDEGRASCRSIDGFDVTALLRRNGDLLRKFGGHRAAAGFSIDAERLDEVRAALIADAGERLDTSSLVPTIEIDAELPLHEVNGDVLRWLLQLGPHGIGNAAPMFLSRGVRVEGNRAVGAGGSHLQFTVRAGAVSWRAISFGNAEYAVPDGQPADVVYRFRRDNLRGTLQLEVEDLRPAS